jgi:hypothetical protein
MSPCKISDSLIMKIIASSVSIWNRLSTGYLSMDCHNLNCAVDCCEQADRDSVADNTYRVNRDFCLKNKLKVNCMRAIITTAKRDGLTELAHELTSHDITIFSARYSQRSWQAGIVAEPINCAYRISGYSWKSQTLSCCLWWHSCSS